MPNLEFSLEELGSVRRGLTMYSHAISDHRGWLYETKDGDVEHREAVEALGNSVDALVERVVAVERAAR